MNTAISMFEPNDDDVERTVSAVEKYIAGQAPPAGPADSRRVRELRAEVDEAHVLVALQADTAPLLVDTDRVRRTRKRAAEAARLHALARNPAALAWQAARVRFVLTAVAVSALCGALAWSTTGVHYTLTRNMTTRDAAWWGAWAVEPVISAMLLVVVAAKAYLASRGATLRHPHLSVVEFGALAVTLTLNIWPYTPWQTDRFDAMQLLAHATGPMIAIGAVTVMPVIWAAFAALPVAEAPTEYRQDRRPEDAVAGRATDARTALLVGRAQQMIANGHLPADPSATRLREALGCGTDAARDVRDTLRAKGTA